MTDLLENFINGNDAALSGKVPPTIFNSWQRCRELSVNHTRIQHGDVLQQPELKQLREQNTGLLFAAEPVMRHIFDFLRNTNYLIVLSDDRGYILTTIGNPSFLERTRQIYLLPGVNWQEKLKGTNGIGTVLVEQTPLIIPNWTHYSSPVNFLDCWAAPVKNNGTLLGVLNISGEAGANHDHLFEITTIGANMIEQRIQITEMTERFNLCRQSLDTIAKSLWQNVPILNDNNRGSKNFPSPGDIPLRKKTAPAAAAKPEAPENKKIIWYGSCAKTMSLYDTILKAAKTDSSILIQGESGTGKEIVARLIHSLGARQNKPFVTLNCAAIPDNLVETELFGYADGAFTGAKKGGQPGKFELANNGTIFLDEIGDMPYNVQASLLRVLQQKEFYRVGDDKCHEANARIIAATNQDLHELVNQGKFRLDLYYRLKVIFVFVPPLRERIEDIWELAPNFVQKFCERNGRPPLEISPDLYRYFAEYSWPGNIRQLENCIESMVALADDSSILTIADLPDEYKGRFQDLAVKPQNELSLQTGNTERIAIIQALKEVRGNVAAAARKLGIGRTTLYRKMEKLGIKH